MPSKRKIAKTRTRKTAPSVRMLKTKKTAKTDILPEKVPETSASPERD